jgi:hypothetical protein
MMKLPQVFWMLNLCPWNKGQKYQGMKRRVYNASLVTQDDIDNLKELFEKDCLYDHTDLIQVDPTIKIVRRLRVRGLIEIGHYREGIMVNFGDKEEVVSESIQVIVARLTSMGKIAINLQTVDDLAKQFKPVA